MRWYVDISIIGPDKPTHRHCVEAEQWQKALQGVRAQRGDDAPFGNFSIELLDDGYRAIDPQTRTRYVVQRAPDDAAVTQEPTLLAGKGTPLGSAAPAVPAARASDPKAAAAARAARPRPSARGERAGPTARTSERGRTRGKAPSIPDDVVPRTAAPAASSPPEATAAPKSHGPSSAPPTAPRPSQQPIPSAAVPPTEPNRPSQSPATAPPSSLPPEITRARPMQAETAFERMTGGAAFALTKQSATADVPTEVLPAHKVLTRRSEDPTPSSPLTYREMALAVAETTSLRDAEAIARAQFEVVRNALAGAPKGKFIQLAIFDHEFTGKPKKVPIVTLAFKDWRDQEPVIAFPQRDGVATRRSSERPSASPGGPKEASPGAGFPASYPPSSIAPAATSTQAAAQVVGASVPPPASVQPAAPPPAPSTPAPAPQPLAPEPEPDSEPIKPTPVIAITDEPMLVRQIPQAQQGATLLERAEPADVPPPTPSQIQRDAKEMAGEDERTLVKVEVDLQPPASQTRNQSPPPPAPSSEELSDSDVIQPSSPGRLDVPPAPPAVAHPATQRMPSVPPPTGASPKREPTSEPPPQVVPIPAPNRTERMAVPANGILQAKPAHLVSDGGAIAHPSAPPPAHASAPPPAPDGNFAMRGEFPVASIPSPPPPGPEMQPRVASVPPGALQSQHPSAPPPAPQASAPPAALAQQNGGLSIKSPRGRRKAGDDLITDLFEACSDLGFVHDALEGADFVMDLVFESIPNRCTLISFFDINTREFVVVRQAVAASAADGLSSVLLGRTSEFTKLVQKTMRAGRASVISSAAIAVIGEDTRFRTLGAEPQSFICAPIVAGGRYLGMIEVLDPLDGAPFTDGDGHALTYIGEQFAEFLSQRDLLLDPERVTRPRLSQQARR